MSEEEPKRCPECREELLRGSALQCPECSWTRLPEDWYAQSNHDVKIVTITGLRACPMCAQDEAFTLTSDDDEDGENCWIECSRCSAFGPAGHSRSEAEANWNQRPEVDRLRAALSKIRHEAQMRTCWSKDTMYDALNRVERLAKAALGIEAEGLPADDPRMQLTIAQEE